MENKLSNQFYQVFWERMYYSYPIKSMLEVILDIMNERYLSYDLIPMEYLDQIKETIGNDVYDALQYIYNEVMNYNYKINDYINYCIAKESVLDMDTSGINESIKIITKFMMAYKKYSFCKYKEICNNKNTWVDKELIQMVNEIKHTKELYKPYILQKGIKYE